MSLYGIIKALQAASGSNAKQVILEQHKDDELLKKYLKAVYDPAINYYQTKLPDVSGWKDNNYQEFCEKDIDFAIENLSTRKVTGYEAIACLGGWASALNSEGRELMSLLIKRSIGAGVGDTMILKVFPDLYFIPPYQRCSLMDDKIKANFKKLNKFAVQIKYDGSFCYLVKEDGKAPEAITRAGSKYPITFTEKLATGLPDGFVLMGELLVYDKDGRMLDRKTGNGMLNSILKGGGLEEGYNVRMTAWDMILPEEFKMGISKTWYSLRLGQLRELLTANKVEFVDIAETTIVHSITEANKIYLQHLAKGYEGSIAKTLDFNWKDGTSKDCIKLKVKFQADYEVIGVIEGKGKYTGMAGAVSYKSIDGIITGEVGTGLTDNDRQDFWLNSEEYIGKIITIEANEIISNRSGDTSLFLPVYIETREDKKVADTYEHCVAQFEAAKLGEM